jgi:type IV secretory pathway TraG/TraD family ATPase VirD4
MLRSTVPVLVHRIAAAVLVLIAAAHLVTFTWALGVWYVDAGFVLLGALNFVAAAVHHANRLRAICRNLNVGVALAALVALLGGTDLIALLFVAAIVGQAAAGLKVLARPA